MQASSLLSLSANMLYRAKTVDERSIVVAEMCIADNFCATQIYPS